MTLIKDQILEPYFIERDQYCYTVYETVVPQRKHWKKSELGESYDKALGYYSSFGSAVKTILDLKVNKEGKTFNSLQEYLKEWEEVKSKIENFLKTN
jgi:hypothetical protein